MDYKTFTQKYFNGGAAEDIYNGAENEIGWSLNMDNTNKKRLFNYNVFKSLAKTNCILTKIGSDGKLYAIAQQNIPTVNIVIYSYDFATESWSILGTSFNGRVLTGRMFEEYHGYLFYFQGTITKHVDRINLSTGVIDNEWRQLNNSGTPITTFSGECFDSLVNIVNDRLYFSYGNHVGRYSNRVGEDLFASPIFSISDTYNVECLARRNNQLALGANPKAGGNQAQVVFWDTFSRFADYSKNILYGNINSLKLVDGDLLCVSSYNTTYATGANNTTNNGLYGYVYSGGEFELVKKHVGIRIPGETVGAIGGKQFATAVHGSMMYFVQPMLMRGYNDPNNLKKNVIWKFGKNQGSWQMTPDREFLKLENASCLTFYNDKIVACNLQDIEITDTVSIARANGKILTLSYDLGYKWRKKKLKALQINCIPFSPNENKSGVQFPQYSVGIYTDNNLPIGIVSDAQTRLSFGKEYTVELEECGVNSMEWETIQLLISVDGDTQIDEISFVYEVKPQQIYDRK